jgi:hypothetical protein
VVLDAGGHRGSAWVWVGECLVWAAKVVVHEVDCDGCDVVLDLLLNSFVRRVNLQPTAPSNMRVAFVAKRIDIQSILSGPLLQ